MHGTLLAFILVALSSAAVAQTSRAPDLTVEITGFTAGQKGSVETLVTNLGRTAAGGSRIELTIDPPPHGAHFKQLNEIGPGEQVPVRIIGTIRPGATLTVTIDAQNEVREGDEDNNIATIEVPREDGAPENTPGPETPDQIAAPQERLPDLTVEIIDVSGGDTGTVRARVRNDGIGDAPGTRIRLERKGELHVYARVPALPAGADVDIELEATLGDGESFALSVDPDGQVDESDERNNTAEGTAPEAFAPEPAPPPRDRPTPPQDIGCACTAETSDADLVVTIEKVDPGSRVIVHARVSNIGSERSVAAQVTLTVTSGKVTHYAAQVPELGPGEDVKIAFEVEVGEPVFEAFVDSGFAVTERDEENNRSDAVTANVDGPIVAGPPIATVGKLPVAIAPSLAAGHPDIEGHHRNAPPRKVAVLRYPSGAEAVFVEDELVIETDAATAAALAERYNGQIVFSFERRQEGRKPSFVIRVDPDTAKLDPPGAAQSKQPALVSSARALGLLSIIAAEQKDGRRASIDPIIVPDSAFDQTIPEGEDYDARTLSYVETGGKLDVNLLGAWQLLELADAPQNTVPMSIIDRGFVDLGDLAPFSGDTGMTIVEDTPYHGTFVAASAAAIYGNDKGGAGPAGRAAKLNLLFSLGSTSDHNAAVLAAANAGAKIINMSWGAYEPIDEGLFLDTYPDSLISFEEDTQHLDDVGLLLFASSGNDGRDVDHTNIDGDEDVWKFPCENKGVYCVGGWVKDLAVKDQYANYGRGIGETVDIAGPYTVLIGQSPANPYVDEVSFRSGTSYATPFVAGVAALILQASPGTDNDVVWELLDKYAKQGDGVRIVNAYGPVREALLWAGKSYAPTAVLDTPKAPIVASQLAPLTLTAHGLDVEDGLDCCTLTWSTDKDGSLGSGKQITVNFADKLPGLRVLKLTATDSSGKSGTRFYVIDFPNKEATLEVLSPKQGDVLAPGVAYDWSARLMDDSTMLAIPMDDCAGLTWSSLSKKDPQPLADGCDVNVSFAEPGKRTIVVSYTDKYDATSTQYVTVDVKEPTGNQIYVVLNKVADDDAFAAPERIPLDYAINDPGAKPTTVYELTWRLGRNAADMRVFTPLQDGTQSYISIGDVFPERMHSTQPGGYTIELTVKDKARPFAGGSATRTIAFLTEIQ